MRRDNILGGTRTGGLMDTISKSTKPPTIKHTIGMHSKTKAKECVPRYRRYSVDIVSSKPITSHSQKGKNGHEGVVDRRFSQRRHSLCTKLETAKSKETCCTGNEVRSILKSGFSSVCNSSVHSSESESSTGSDDKQSTSNDVKCSYRLPKSTGTGQLRKSVSFREDTSSTNGEGRRLSSPVMDTSTNYLLATTTS